MKDYYEILGVSPNSDEVVIRAAYRAMMRKHHPDSSTSEQSEGLAYDINEAFEVLSDPARRRAYDDARRGPQSSATPEDPVPPAPPTTNQKASGAGCLWPVVGVFGLVFLIGLILAPKEEAKVDGAVAVTTAANMSPEEGTKFQYTSRVDDFTDTLHSRSWATLPSVSGDNMMIDVRFDCQAKQVGDKASVLTATVELTDTKTNQPINSVGFRIGKNPPYQPLVMTNSFGASPTQYTTELYDLHRNYGGLTSGGAMIVRVESVYAKGSPSDANIDLADPSLKRVFADCQRFLDWREEATQNSNGGSWSEALVASMTPDAEAAQPAAPAIEPAAGTEAAATGSEPSPTQ